MATFSAQVSDWVKDTDKALTMVYRTAIDDMFDEIIRTKPDGGMLPIDTGNLRRSFLASTSSIPSLRPDVTDFPTVDNSLVIAGVEYGETVYAGFQAAYAARQNYGFTGQDSLGRSYNQAGNYFFDINVEKWPQFVADAERKFKVK